MARPAVVAAFMLLGFSILALRSSVHTIPEGHVGVYYRGGALLQSLSEPGIHLKLPFVTTVEPVQVTVQTDRVTNIPCGTSGGVMIYFESIEVINMLKKDKVYDTIKNYTVNYDKTWIFDKIHHAVNQFCSLHTLQEVYIDLFDTIDDRLVEDLQRDCNQWAPGIQIISCRVTKPKIPASILNNFEMMEAEKTKLLIANQHQKVVEREADTERRRATIEAEKARTVAEIRTQMEIMEKEAVQRMARIEDEIHVAHQKALSDAAFYQATREAEANRAKLTPEFIVLEALRAMSNNTKFFFGDRVPSVMLQQLMGPGDVLQAVERAREASAAPAAKGG